MPRTAPPAAYLIACLFGAFFCVAALAAEPPAVPAAPKYADHRTLLVVRDDSGAERPVHTAADWALRRRHILAGMQQAMGPLPDRSQLPVPALKVVEETPAETFTRQRITLTSNDPLAPEGDIITAYLFLPKGAAGPRPAMLALHPTGAPGKDIVAGIAGKANRQYGSELAERGYVVLAPDYLSFGELAKYDFEADQHVSGTMKGIWNHLRCVDFLVSRPEVDRQRLGVIGHSLGGHNSMFAAVFDERLKVAVSSCGWCPFHDYYGGKIAGWTSSRYMPRLKDVYQLDPNQVPFDFYEVVAAMAPRAFYSVSPVRDSNFDVAGVKKGIAAAEPVYKLLGKPEALAVQYPDCEHDFPDDMRRAAYEFIDRVLEHRPTKAVP